MARLKDIYRNEIAPKLKEELKLGNVMETPRVTKITLNMGLGEAIGDKKVIENALGDWKRSPVKSRWSLSPASRSLASKSAKAGRIGVKVTLRSDKMYEFLDRLLSISLPACVTSAA